MNFNKTFFSLSILLCSSFLFAQEAKRAMTVEDLIEWRRITQQTISNDGKWVAVKSEPWKGDAALQIFNAQGVEISSFSPAKSFNFSSSSRHIVIEQTPFEKEIEEHKLKKTPKNELPVNSLTVYSLNNNHKEIIDSVKSFELCSDGDYLAYNRGREKDSMLYIRSLDGKNIDSIPSVSGFGFSKQGTSLYFLVKGENAGLYVFEPDKRAQKLIHQGKGDYQKVAFNKEGDRLAFLYTSESDTTKKASKKVYSLFLSESLSPADSITSTGDNAFPENWIVSSNGDVYFSDNSEQLFFGTSPVQREIDTTLLLANRPNVQVWSWDEKVQHTQQVVDKKKDEKKTYTAVYNLASKKIIQLANKDLPDIQLPNKGDFALLSTSEPYGTQSMWTGRDQYDIFKVNIKTGERKLLKKEINARVMISPAGKYAYWNNVSDSSWYTYSLTDDREFRLTTPESFVAWDEDDDRPDFPRTYGSAGWSEHDADILIYDRYDVWRFSPTSANTPVNLTVDGRRNNLVYRLLSLDEDVRFVDFKETQTLSGFNEKTKASGYYSAKFTSASSPKVLLEGDFRLSSLIKAKKSEAVIYSSETYIQYPEIKLSDLKFRKSIQLTHLGRQQDKFIWGSAERIFWTSLDGIQVDGIIYKPENFDPTKKYPVIVNFYERNSNTFHSYRTPEPHRSTVDYRLYNSNEYIIFNPDIIYKTGYPGESCFNSVMPGISKLISLGYVDEKAIGAQGHSWGGYQVAYLATRTNLFAAIESGAPVVNMFSAYGGIRWETGLNRAFQYEHTQSRIGATPWESTLRYQENSPLFTMDKVTTPILIMHNDADGHVPWYQGIEYFIALKRLQKPVWMLNYPGEPHWPTKMPNKVDFQKRMFQFFNHYLKNAPMPKWMSEGVKAIDQPFELGY